MAEQISNTEQLTAAQRALLALKELRAKYEALLQKTREPIAIVGIGCRFPGGADGPQSFWRLLHDGIDAITEVPRDRWDIDAYYDPDPDAPGKMYCRFGGFIDAVDRFDARFFGITPREASSMDPQQRLLLEVSWEALEDAGIVPDQLMGSLTGVFIGISTSDYTQVRGKTGESIENMDAYVGTGNAFSVASGRLSYILGLQGPNLAVDTACSSSLVSVHLAVQSLRNGEADLALAGGVNLMLAPETTINFSRARMLAPDGRCKTFDARADGYVRGEGCGMVVLKRLSDAIAGGDTIYAVIRGSAVNQDGRSNGLTAPNGPAQEAVLRRALAAAGVAPAEIDYVEAHGTGTSLGDPIEIRALGAVMRDGRKPEHPLCIGSAKTNFGHLEAAAGVAGLIKAALALHHQAIPAHLHFQSLNPHISISEIPAEIPTSRHAWPRRDTPRFAGVSSFGFSGTNAHIVLGEAPTATVDASRDARPLQLFSLSAKSAEALREQAGRYHTAIEGLAEEPLANICHTANVHRSYFAHRTVLQVRAREALLDQLAMVRDGTVPTGAQSGQVTEQKRAKIAFLFTGQGAQYAGMGKTLYDTHPVFREALDACNKILEPLLPKSLLAVMFAEGADAALLDQTQYTQPALFALEFALARLWQSWGIEPDVVLGHSVGEYVAACIAGLFSLEDGLKLIAERGRLMQSLPQNGDMAAVFADEAAVAGWIDGVADKVSIAACNGPENTVISGEAAAVAEVLATLEQNGVKYKKLTVSHAFHSPLMEPILDDFARIAGEIEFRSPEIPVISNVTGEPAGREAFAQPAYWQRHIREAVQFHKSMQQVHAKNCALLLEIGPSPTLIGMGMRCLPDGWGTWLPSLRKGKDDWEQMLSSLAGLHVRGVKINWAGFDRPFGPHQRVALPTYAFQRQRYWIAEKPEAASSAQPDDLFYRVDWQPAATIPANGSTGQEDVTPQHWLLFAGSDGIATALSEAMTAKGHQVAIATHASSFSQTGAQHFSLDFRDAAQVQQVLASVSASAPLTGVVYLAATDLPTYGEQPEEQLASLQDLACTAPLALIQSLAAPASASVPRLVLVTRGAQVITADVANLAVAQAPLWGLARTLAIELPELRCRRIDLDPADAAKKSAAHLLVELLHGESEDQVAYRDSKRFVARLAHETLPAATEELKLPGDAAYLISGGTRGLGLRVARWLVEHGARHLVLLSRSAPPPASQQVIGEIEETGAHVHLLQADVADGGQLQAAFEAIAGKLPPLKGIFHAAGTLDDCLLRAATPDRFARVLAPKVAGTLNLHRLAETAELDFFVLFSSVAALLGSPGQGNYAAANAFLDAFAHWRRLQGLAASSINFGPWAETGMAAALGAERQRQWQAQGLELLSVDDGLHSLQRVLQQQPVQIGAFRVTWATLQRQLSGQPVPPFLSRLLDNTGAGSVPQGPSPQWLELLERYADALTANRRALVQHFIAARAATIIGVASGDELDPQQGFFEMGMDSLMAVELKNALEQATGTPLPRTLTFEYPNIEAIAAFLQQQIIDAAGDEAEEASAEQAAPVEPEPETEIPGDDLLAQFDGQMKDITELMEKK